MAKSPAKPAAASATPADDVTVAPPTASPAAPLVVPPGTIDPEAFYSVKMRRVANLGSHRLRPTGDYVLKGRAVISLGDAVASYARAGAR
jgi:hypothetical protein